jgi:hypothetical protein
VHHEYPVSALLSLHAKVVQGKQVSQGYENGIHGPPSIIRRGMKGESVSGLRQYPAEIGIKEWVKASIQDHIVPVQCVPGYSPLRAGT